jgi:putative restriction endonuclease
LKGEDKLRFIKTRVNQHVFRQIVLQNYSGKCAISGIDLPELLVASHIVPWATSPGERLNPQNGICLSALYDKAYDNGYIGIDENCVVVVSNALTEKRNQRYFKTWFAPLHNRRLTMPIKYIPDRAFLQYHMDVIFKR